MHRVAARGLLHPPAALWAPGGGAEGRVRLAGERWGRTVGDGALLEPLARCKLREGGVRGLGVAPLRLELLAAHAGVPRFGAAEEAETLGAEGALQLSVVRLPCKNKRAARRGAVPVPQAQAGVSGGGGGRGGGGLARPKSSCASTQRCSASLSYRSACPAGRQRCTSCGVRGTPHRRGSTAGQTSCSAVTSPASTLPRT